MADALSLRGGSVWLDTALTPHGSDGSRIVGWISTSPPTFTRACEGERGRRLAGHAKPPIMKASRLRAIPSVDKVLRSLGDTGLPGPVVVDAVRRYLKALRSKKTIPPAAAVLAGIRSSLQSLRASRLTPVINGTGILVHTNLGRAPLDLQHPRAFGDRRQLQHPRIRSRRRRPRRPRGVSRTLPRDSLRRRGRSGGQQQCRGIAPHPRTLLLRRRRPRS